MATWTFNRPAISFSAQDDVDGAIESAALPNSPGGFAAPVSAVSIASTASAVDVVPGANSDSYGVSVRIMSGATVLAAADSGGGYVQVTASAPSGSYPQAFAISSFPYVLTTATQAQWDAATIVYQQQYSKAGGPDRDYITVAAGTNDITVTYTAASAPSLTLPTEVSITTTTATVGCTTNTADGDLYWFVSTSATAPTATDLKAGTGAFNGQFGSQANPGVGTETFSVSGLDQSGTYYTYFVHNNAVGDSNILESGSWLTHSSITADDLGSTSSVSTPTFSQVHILSSVNLASTSTISTPTIVQDHAILASDIVSASSISVPTLSITIGLFADNIQSSSEAVTTTLAQEHNLLANGLQSTSALSVPTISQEHVILTSGLSSTSVTSNPTISGEHALTVSGLQSVSQVSTPTLETAAGIFTLFADDIQSTSAVGTPALSETIKYLTPMADDSVGNWTTNTGSASNLYQQIDEILVNDTDYIRSEPAPSASAVRFTLSDGSTTPVVEEDQRVRYRYGKDVDDGTPLNLTVRLIEGASTVRATWVHSDISPALLTANQVLTEPQKASITDYNNLYIEFEATI